MRTRTELCETQENIEDIYLEFKDKVVRMVPELKEVPREGYGAINRASSK